MRDSRIPGRRTIRVRMTSSSYIGWVQRSEIHHNRLGGMMGSAIATPIL
jgi:hypothetical protein